MSGCARLTSWHSEYGTCVQVLCGLTDSRNCDLFTDGVHLRDSCEGGLVASRIGSSANKTTFEFGKIWLHMVLMLFSLN